MKPELTYIQCGDYWIPNLKLESTEERPLNKYGRMRPDLPAGAQTYPIQPPGDAAEAVPPSVGGSGSRGVPIGADYGRIAGAESRPRQSS